MDDQTNVSASNPSLGRKQSAKTGACIGVFSQLFDWNRVLGSKSYNTRYLAPDAPNSTLHDVDASDKRAIVKKILHNHAAYEQPEQLEGSVTKLIGLNAIPGSISSQVDVETPKELRQLLHVKQGPFVLCEVLQEKRQRPRRSGADAKTRACMKAQQDGQANRPQSSKRIKVNDGRKHEAEVGSARSSTQATSSAQRIMRAPADSIVATPSSPLRNQFAAKSRLSPTVKLAASPGKSPLRSPNKKALLMEAAAKILEGSSRSSKLQTTVRSLLVEMEMKHAQSAAKPSKKPSKSKPLQRVSSDKHARAVQQTEKLFEQKNSNKVKKSSPTIATGVSSLTAFKAKHNFGISESAELDLGTSASKRFAQKPEKDPSSQSKVFPYDKSLSSSGKTVGALASPVQETNASNRSKIGAHLFYGRFFRTGKERKGGNAVDTSLEVKGKEGALLRSFLRRKDATEDHPSGRILSRTAEGTQTAAIDLATCEKFESARDHVDIQDFEFVSSPTENVDRQCLEPPSGLWLQECLSSRYLNKDRDTVLRDVEEECYQRILFDSDDQSSEGNSFPIFPSEALQMEGCTLGTDQFLDSDEFCKGLVPDSDSLGTYQSPDEGVELVPLESSRDSNEASHSLQNEAENLIGEPLKNCSDEKCTSALIASSLSSGLPLDADCNELPKEPGQPHNSLGFQKIPSLLKLCDFSWWDQEANHNTSVGEQDQEIRHSFDQLPQGTEEAASFETIKSPPFLRVFGQERDEAILEGESPTSPNSLCMDEFQQSSPVSVLDATFEEDSPIHDKSLAGFEEARQQLLDNVRRYELLAQMDLETLIKYTEADSCTEEDEDYTSEALWGEETDAANISAISSQHQAGVSPGFGSFWNEGEEDTEGARDEGVGHGDESSFPQFQNEGIQSSEETGSMDLIERLKKGERLSCKIFFDCVTEALEPDAVNYGKEAHAWLKVPRNLLQEIKKMGFSWPLGLMDALLTREIGCTRSRWRDFSKEVEEIGTEVENTVCGLLMQELLSELMEDM